ncbi:alpha-L-rhamnosidase C-terminal domain-containing protein [Niabella aurantiaca]|uniref:alpha-L-rhamnosidase-related protein n=1 Tax=Niabella aurantiaca TaxID=379900 RepID=UPI00035D8902|nr:alpha-L-rhamnosidase C-terminal domain-containing protein [Niabella aurantiaca]
MMRTVFFFIMALSALLSHAQAPSRLRTELLEHTDRVFLDGYLTTLSLQEAGTAIERYQVAAIRSARPSFSWVVNSGASNTLQAAYRIQVASSREKLAKGEADIWDSRKVKSGHSVAVPFEGAPLQPSRIYYWNVKTWDNHGVESPFSEIKGFITARELDGKTAQYPLQITDEYPVKVKAIGPGSTFIDFGKAAFGKLRLTLRSDSGKDTVTIHLGEHSVNGRVDRKPGGSVRYTVYQLPLIAGVHTYTIKFRPDGRNTRRKANESGVDPVFMPAYIGEVFPFRYGEICNYIPPVTDKDIVRQSVHYPFDDGAAAFHSSDSVLNNVWDLCRYSVKATSFLGTYVDGDRERLPYEADALINQLCHYYADREFSMARHTLEYLLYNATWPTEWNLQPVLMAWNDYRFTGNKDFLEQYYDDLKAKTLLALKEDNGLISTRTGKMTTAFYRSIHFKGKALRDIVDWPQSGNAGNEKEQGGEADGYVFTTYNTVVNAYHYEALRLMSRIAGVLNRKRDQQFYEAAAGNVKKQFNRLLFDPKKGHYKDGVETDHSSLHANMFPLAFDMVPEKNIEQVAAFIRSRRMACSVYGAQFLLDAVYEADDAGYGLALLSSTGERSWYNMIRAGSTITMEAWDNRYKPNQDWNHAWGAAPANIIPGRLMGVTPAEPGFEKICIRPRPASLREASLKMPSIRGDIRVSFVNDPGVRFALQAAIPANTTAEVWLPFSGKKYRLLVDGSVQKGTLSGAFVKVDIGSGRHTLRIEDLSEK